MVLTPTATGDFIRKSEEASGCSTRSDPNQGLIDAMNETRRCVIDAQGTGLGPFLAKDDESYRVPNVSFFPPKLRKVEMPGKESLTPPFILGEGPSFGRPVASVLPEFFPISKIWAISLNALLRLHASSGESTRSPYGSFSTLHSGFWRPWIPFQIAATLRIHLCWHGFCSPPPFRSSLIRNVIFRSSGSAPRCYPRSHEWLFRTSWQVYGFCAAIVAACHLEPTLTRLAIVPRSVPGGIENVGPALQKTTQ